MDLHGFLFQRYSEAVWVEKLRALGDHISNGERLLYTV